MMIVFVALGGFFGAISRFAISQLLSKKTSFPSGTLTVNLIGSLLLGIIIGLELPSAVALLLGTGFLGAFTTFSTLSFEMVKMIQSKRKKEWLIYVLVTYVGGITLAYIGFLIGKIFMN